jgi:DNA primase
MCSRVSASGAPGSIFHRTTKTFSAPPTLLDDIGLMGFLKTSGGKGLPVVVPIRAALHWDHAKGFTNGVADLPVRTFPQRIYRDAFEDAAQEQDIQRYSSTTCATPNARRLSLRMRCARAPVHRCRRRSARTQLSKDIRFDCFNVRNIRARANRKRKDLACARPMGRVETNQTVTKAIFKRAGSQASRV